MRSQKVFALAGSLVFLLSACAAQQSSTGSSSTSSEKAEAATAIAVPPPANSPLAKVKLGMSKTDVSTALGSPTGQNSYPTGKAFIPFYFGNDARRTSWYYKGMGRVVFADGNVFGGGTPEVVRVDYDPTETGIARE